MSDIVVLDRGSVLLKDSDRTRPGEKEVDTVPTTHPYGSITDDDWVCSRCGANLTGCGLCIGMRVSVVRVRR